MRAKPGGFNRELARLPYGESRPVTGSRQVVTHFHRITFVRMLGNLLAVLVVIGVLGAVLSPTGCSRPQTPREVVTARSLFQVLTKYASDHGGSFPEAVDESFLDECIHLGYITENERGSCIIKDAPVGSTGFFYIKGQRQTMRGSNLLAISEQPILDQDYGPRYVTLTLSGRAEAMSFDDLVPYLAYVVRQNARRDMDAQKSTQSQQ